VAWELTTVADDEAVFFDGPRLHRLEGLLPDSEYEFDGIAFRTLTRPPGELVATIATVNDVHFGESECGVVEGLDVGPILRSALGSDPYPDVMNRAAVMEIMATRPDLVVAKGDLTTSGTLDEYESFLACYAAAFGERLIQVRGNHDAKSGFEFATEAPIERVLPGVVVAVLDTVVPGRATGQVTARQLEWLDDLARRADRPVLVFGHHHPWAPGSRARPAEYFGINPDDSERLVELVARRPALIGYFAGHTHRNRVRRFQPTGTVPWVEVACVKDFPGSWAEYRVFEGGVLQVHRRIASSEALAWSEACRAMIGGLYPEYAFGELEDRCFPIWPR
jgi:3',5'-cyclic-AMP phosphodiesterase